jgi:ribulose-phosphate 3-epimerase
MRARPHLSASILNADFGRLGVEVARATVGGVDSIHLDVMDGHFVDNLTFGPVVVEAVRADSALPFHSHLMISRPLAYAERFAEAGSDVIVFHVEADDEPRAVIAEIERAGKTAEAVLPWLDQVDLLLVMTVHPGWGGQAFIHDVMPKLRALRDEVDRRELGLQIGVDGGVNLETIGTAAESGGDVLVVGSALYSTAGDLAPTVAALRAAADARPELVTDPPAERT